MSQSPLSLSENNTRPSHSESGVCSQNQSRSLCYVSPLPRRDRGRRRHRQVHDNDVVVDAEPVEEGAEHDEDVPDGVVDGLDLAVDEEGDADDVGEAAGDEEAEGHEGQGDDELGPDAERGHAHGQEDQHLVFMCE